MSVAVAMRIFEILRNFPKEEEYFYPVEYGYQPFHFLIFYISLK